MLLNKTVMGKSFSPLIVLDFARDRKHIGKQHLFQAITSPLMPARGAEISTVLFDMITK